MDEPQWMAYAGFVFDALASLTALVAILLAVRAYRVAVQSYRAAQEQHRKAIELEVLKSLIIYHDELDKSHPETTEPIPELGLTAGLKLLALPKHELPLWRGVYEYHNDLDGPTWMEIVAHPLISKEEVNGHPEDVQLAVWLAMGQELYEAIRRRSE